MSDLQCPARLFLVPTHGSPSAAVLAALREERVVAVYGPPHGTAAELADQLGTTLGGPAGLEELADRHRGEAVALVGDHPGDDPLVMVEIDADGRRTVPWP